MGWGLAAVAEFGQDLLDFFVSEAVLHLEECSVPLVAWVHDGSGI